MCWSFTYAFLELSLTYTILLTLEDFTFKHSGIHHSLANISHVTLGSGLSSLPS